MAVTIANYSYRQKITGDAPASSLSGFVALITADNVNSTFFDNVDNGGGDVRVSINADGTSQLPLQVEVCNTTTDKLYAWVRFPTYSTAAREIYIFAGNSGETQPAVTATYGRNNVWQDYLAVNHGRDLVNSTGGNNFTVLGTAPTAISQKHGAGWNFNAGNGLLLSAISASAEPEFTMESFGGFVDNVIPDSSDQPFFAVVSLAVQASSFGLDYTILPYQSDTPFYRFSVNTPQNNFQNIFSANGSHYGDGGYFALTRDSDSLYTAYGFDSANTVTGSSTISVSNTVPIDTFGIGGRADTSETYYNNVTVEARARIGVLSANHLASHSSNYIDPANFWTQSTPTNPSAGGGITAAGDITLPSLVFAGNATDTTSEVTAAGDITLPSLVFAGNATDTTSEVTATGDITLPSLVFAGSATDTTSEVTATGDITLPSLVFAGNATDTTSEVTAAGDITLPSLVFAGTAAITETSEVTATGDITLPSLVFAGSATETTSEITAAGDITLPSLVFAGNATAGQVISDFTIQIDNTAKIIETTPNSFTIRI